MNQPVQKFIFSTFNELFNFINPALTNYDKFNKSLSKQIKIKKHENIQYNFDVVLDNLIVKNLKSFNITGRIFSEERGFFDNGEKNYRVVYDPFCNSSLASRTFLEAAIGISIFDYNYNFITSAIMDYQTGIVGIVEDKKTNFYQVQNKGKLSLSGTNITKVKDSYTVITLENQKERKHIAKAMKILLESKRIMISSGHIYWLRLAAGKVDSYLDPFGGERLYEMFASTIAQNAGCTVTDLHGVEFDPARHLKIFEKNPDFIYYPVAASNKKLHRSLLKSLGGM